MADRALSPLGVRRTVAEVKEEFDAERSGLPFLMYRDEHGAQRIVTLQAPITVGRRRDCDVSLEWDSEVSRTHAKLEPVGADWTLVDDGLSRNGSFVNGTRVAARRRLADGDALRFGGVAAVFRAPGDGESEMTAIAGELPEPAQLSDSQRRVLVALCRPFADPSGFATPATNQEIATEVFLGVDAVKMHLRALFQKFGIENLPQNQKRAALAKLALLSGAVSEREL